MLDYNDEDAVWAAMVAQVDQMEACLEEIVASEASIIAHSAEINTMFDHLDVLIQQNHAHILINQYSV